MATTVQRLGRTTNLVHGFIYFSSQAAEQFSALGLAGNQRYFAGRAAAMGPVDADAVIDSFYNFNPEVVRLGIPSAWVVALPADVQQARFRAAADVLSSAGSDVHSDAISQAIEIAHLMIDGVSDEAKPLAAGNRAVEIPDEPLVALWQLVTIVREWRGDAHVNALRAADVSGIEALILHAATGQVPVDVLKATRAWSDDAWDNAIAGLAARGLVQPDGTFTPQGEQYRKEIEAATNAEAQALVDAVGDEQASTFCDLLRPIRDGLLASGVFSNSLS